MIITDENDEKYDNSYDINENIKNNTILSNISCVIVITWKYHEQNKGRAFYARKDLQFYYI